MGQQTTIRLDETTKTSLDRFKLIARESYDDVVKRILSILQESFSEEELNQKTVKALQNRMDMVKAGKVMTSAELKNKLFPQDEVSKKMDRRSKEGYQEGETF